MGAFTPGLLIGYAIYGITFGAICRWLAIQKNRSGSNWFIVGFILGFIGLLLIGFAPALAPSPKKQRDGFQQRRAASPSVVQQANTLHKTDRLTLVSVSALLTALVLWAIPLNIYLLIYSDPPGVDLSFLGSMSGSLFCSGSFGIFNTSTLCPEELSLEDLTGVGLVLAAVITSSLRFFKRLK